jgi:hypothetical protein
LTQQFWTLLTLEKQTCNLMNVILAFDALLSRGNLILFRPFVWIFIIYNYPYLANVTIENVSCVYSQQEKQHLRLDPITTRSVVLLQIQVSMEQVLSLWRGIVFTLIRPQTRDSTVKNMRQCGSMIAWGRLDYCSSRIRIAKILIKKIVCIV